MKIFAISDFHISTNTDKPMDIFGGNWVNYLDKIKADWENKVSDGDIVLIAGDISWAMNIEDAKEDLDFFKDMVKEVNRSAVNEEDRLIDNAYFLNV